jgi:hypothetical protein
MIVRDPFPSAIYAELRHLDLSGGHVSLPSLGLARSDALLSPKRRHQHTWRGTS